MRKKEIKNTTAFFAAILVLALAPAAVLAAGGRSEQTHGKMHQVDSEFQFLVEMIPHHQEAVDTARETAARSNRGELKIFSEDIIREQTGEINLMREWLSARHPGKSTEAAYRPMMRPVAGLSAERADQTFLEDMIMHHRMAVDMANQVLTRKLSDRPEVVKLANDIIRSQNAEIEQMEKWLLEWYGVKSVGPLKH
jgi:uncharacterized protein (DUF305 family)